MIECSQAFIKSPNLANFTRRTDLKNQIISGIWLISSAMGAQRQDERRDENQDVDAGVMQ